MGAFLSAFGLSLIAGVPIVVVLGLSALAYVAFNDQLHLLGAFPQRMISGVDQFVLLTVPLFILAGNLMNAGAITERIIRFCQVLVGRFRGGLALVNVMSSMLFSGVSGSATADSAALGSVLIPGMKKAGYDAEYAAALTAVSSVIGPIIPPSIQLIIFAVLSGTSVASLFMAGIVPGILIGLGLMAHAVYVARKRNYPKEDPANGREILRATAGAWPALLLPVIILGGILSGVFTPTEAAAVASLYALFIAGVVYRTLTMKVLAKVLYDTAVISSVIMLVVAMANIIAFVFTIEQVPQTVVNAMLEISDNKYVLLAMITIGLLILGALLEPIGALILTVPVLLELGATLGLDPLHLGVIVVLNLVIGLATPPIGLCLFIVCSIAKLPLERVARASLPMLGIALAVLILVTLVPDLVLFVPRLFN
ncbi:TRAP transporter large permease [Alkalilimnicola sp. S0819]|uniref:TRAP transporter large permease n=1 Tax=Alkalilimnicola sp. S0819 TaxID=2613922 RepID=UPI001261F6D0|nr:TRAP transporter large permease [Alkalilimnicola sp. S0819]KAB7623677.1 TRAP transporter large permease [Alkalilimnicola sp. S0819]MPQ16804.1 TRAP transporter large permease subunit [Alkalilimnicola sp. S0819]